MFHFRWAATKGEASERALPLCVVLLKDTTVSARYGANKFSAISCHRFWPSNDFSLFWRPSDGDVTTLERKREREILNCHSLLTWAEFSKRFNFHVKLTVCPKVIHFSAYKFFFFSSNYFIFLFPPAWNHPLTHTHTFVSDWMSSMSSLERSATGSRFLINVVVPDFDLSCAKAITQCSCTFTGISMTHLQHGQDLLRQFVVKIWILRATHVVYENEPVTLCLGRLNSCIKLEDDTLKCSFVCNDVRVVEAGSEESNRSSADITAWLNKRRESERH